MLWRIVNFEPLGQALSFGRGERLIPDSKKMLDYCDRREDFWSFKTARKVTD